MHFEELEPDEQIAFAGLVRLMIRMDGELSPSEVTAVSVLARDIGAPNLWMLMTDTRALESAEVSRRVTEVSRTNVREWMYGVLVGLAAVDGVDPAEATLLDWLREVWELTPE